MKKKIIVLYSSGLDSFLMWRLRHYITGTPADFKAIYFNHGQAVANEEISHLPEAVQVRRIEWLDIQGLNPIECPGRNEGAIFIPGRNLVFAVTAACQEIPDEIWMGTLHGETHDKGTDKNYEFLARTNQTINYVLGPFLNGKQVQVKFPLADLHLNKKDLCAEALKRKVATREEIANTYSCHSGDKQPCGECVQCVKRWAIFEELGIPQPLYQVTPPDTFRAIMMYEEMKTNGEKGYYNQASIDEIYSTLDNYYKKFPKVPKVPKESPGTLGKTADLPRSAEAFKGVPPT